MNSRSLQSALLTQLDRSKRGLTAAALKRRLVPRGTSFHEEVQLRAEIDRALLALKHDHRAYPHGRDKRWKTTSKGSKRR